MRKHEWLLPRLCEEDFDPHWYLSANPDVRAAGVDAWQHYTNFGHSEGRPGVAIRALELDHILWRGFAREAEVELRSLLCGNNTRERAVAGWVMARYAASKGRWSTARSAIRRFTEAPTSAQYVAHPGPWLLAVQAETRLGDLAAAREVYMRALEKFGSKQSFLKRIWNLLRTDSKFVARDRNLVLASLELALGERADDRIVGGHLSALHASTQLVSMDLQLGTAPRFDRLSVNNEPRSVTDGPMVSVIVPAYCAEHTISTSLRGLSAQSWRNLEIIVVDDCSSDQTAKVVETEAKRDPRIRLIRSSINGGAYVARNVGVEAAQGVFVTVHDADDWSHPQKIEEQVKPLLNKGGLQATVSHWVRMDNDLHMTRWRMEEGWIYRNVSSLMIRTELRDSLGYWDRVRANADTEYYHRLLAAFESEAIEEVHVGIPLSFGRTQRGSLTEHAATHLSTQFRGARRSYIEAAHDWHRRRIATLPKPTTAITRAGALHLSARPKLRPFLAPEELGPSDPYDYSDDYGRVAASPYFNADWYLRRNTDVLLAEADPVSHYLSYGAAEDRDPGPLFPQAAWRRIAPSSTDATLLLSEKVQNLTASGLRLPCFSGRLDRADRPTVLVFAHAAEKLVFGAERSLLTALDRLAHGYSGEALAPVVVLPSAMNADYLEQVRARAIGVKVLPHVWYHRHRTAPAATVKAIRDLIRQFQPREVHVNTIALDSPLIAARQERCRTVVHVRELPAQDADLCRVLGDTPEGLRRRLLAQADHIIANSRAVADWINCPARISLWHNQVDQALFEEPFSPGETLRVALISSNIAKKGIADFVSVAKTVAQLEAASGAPTESRCRFYFIGPSSPELLALGPLPTNVEHAGYAPEPVVAMKKCDLVLSLSHFAESFGRTVLEAMAAGRPVISYNRGTPPTFIQSGISGIVVPADEPNAVAKAVFTLSRSREDLSKMSVEARAAARRLNQRS